MYFGNQGKMSSGVRILPHYTHEDYLRWEGRWELINGIAYDMSLIATPEHQNLAVLLSVIFQTEINKNNCSCKVYQPIDLKISEDTIVNPDLLVICEKVSGQYYDKPPKLVAEIISPSSRIKDTITKFDLYKAFGIKYYLLIDPVEKKASLFELSDEEYLLKQDNLVILDSECSLDLKFDNLFD